MVHRIADHRRASAHHLPPGSPSIEASPLRKNRARGHLRRIRCRNCPMSNCSSGIWMRPASARASAALSLAIRGSSQASSELAQRLEGARITESLRHGKHLLVHLGPPGWLTVHFGMNGSLRHFEDGEDDPPYDRLCLDFADGHHLAYVNPRLLGRVGLARDAAEFIAAERLGPGALNPRFDLAAFERALAGRKRNLKSVLMDQEVVAGIGNVYSDEILFQARLHPRTRSDWLDAATRERLFR